MFVSVGWVSSDSWNLEAAKLVETTVYTESQPTMSADSSVSSGVRIFLISLIFRKQINLEKLVMLDEPSVLLRGKVNS